MESAQPSGYQLSRGEQKNAFKYGLRGSWTFVEPCGGSVEFHAGCDPVWDAYDRLPLRG